MPRPDRTGSPDGTPAAAERGRLVTALVAMGYRGTDLADIIAPGRTRRQIADDLIEMQRRAQRGA